MAVEKDRVHGGVGPAPAMRRGTTPGRGRGRGRALVLFACGVLLGTGCASMPDSGEVDRVDASQRADADSQVRVWGVPPRPGAQPSEIVRGFLEATTSDESDYRTARLYLTEQASKRWQPSQQTTVLADGPLAQQADRSNADREENGYTAELTGKRLATVDNKHAYRPEGGAYRVTVHLIKVGDDWRIDTPPVGLVLGQSDFQRIYHSVNKYYFAHSDPGADKAGGRKEVLIADPVYLRRRIDPIAETVRALLAGPTNWLDPVADSKFPSGTALEDNDLALDDSNGLTVRLNDKAARVEPAQCSKMAAQLLFTVQDQTSTKLSRVQLKSDGGELCVLTRLQAEAYAPAGLKKHAEQQYFLDAEHRLVSLSDNSDTPRRVPGPFGDGALPLKSVGVSRDETMAAGVSATGRQLYVARLAQGAPRGEPRLHSEAKRPEDGLTAPSWDGAGDLWVADRDPARPRLLRLRGGGGQPEQVAVPSLGDGRIEALRVASDGVRIALLVNRGGRTTLELGRVERSANKDGPPLSVNDLQSIAPRLEQVVSASWAGGSRLVVVGKEAGVQQLQFMETDGSASNIATLPGINGVKAVAASEDESKPLIANSEDGIVRLPMDANWQLVTKEGSAPVYPG
ncbi:LpqB family beta-propeller domain-containing protein [Streptomyces sp. URMC 123]|uniref:LpqB family beta-propeller domain-containing protein n=1 Tax=Streptomyces sp. URMC 123 TaxID=3423403 RepID=UPI003F1BEAF9